REGDWARWKKRRSRAHHSSPASSARTEPKCYNRPTSTRSPMHRRARFFLAFALALPFVARAEPDAPPPASAPSPPSSRSGLDILIDKSKVDLKEHRLEVKMNHVASKVTIKVYDESGVVLADDEQDFAGRPPGSALVVAWSPSTDA